MCQNCVPEAGGYCGGVGGIAGEAGARSHKRYVPARHTPMSLALFAGNVLQGRMVAMIVASIVAIRCRIILRRFAAAVDQLTSLQSGSERPISKKIAASEQTSWPSHPRPRIAADDNHGRGHIPVNHKSSPTTPSSTPCRAFVTPANAVAFHAMTASFSSTADLPCSDSP